MEETLLEYFEWYLPSDCGHWRRVAENASRLAALGFTGMWLPPAYKGHQGREDVGYGVYDLYDLGEFDQKGSVATKYGTWEEYLSAIYQFEGKEWDWEVDGELGNYDYLMGTGLDMGSPKVVEDLDRWGKWYL